MAHPFASAPSRRWNGQKQSKGMVTPSSVLSYIRRLQILSVRLPDPLENKLAAYCETAGLSKSAVVRAALEKHLKMLAPGRSAKSSAKRVIKDPFLGLIGSGNRKYSTDQVMRMTRGDDWNPA